MNTLLNRIYIEIQSFIERQEGQDLVEYALLITLIALAAITGVKKVATAVNLIYGNISTTLA